MIDSQQMMSLTEHVYFYIGVQLYINTIGVGTCWKQGAQEVTVINYKLILVNNY